MYYSRHTIEKQTWRKFCGQLSVCKLCLDSTMRHKTEPFIAPKYITSIGSYQRSMRSNIEEFYLNLDKEMSKNNYSNFNVSGSKYKVFLSSY